MLSKLRRIGLIIKSASITLLLHGILIIALLAGLWWPFNYQQPQKELPVIQVEAVSIGRVAALKEEKKRKEVERKRAEEKKRKEAERKRAEEKKRKEAERKRAEEKKRKEAERKRAEEKKRKEAERKRAEEKKRKEVERKRAEEKKRKEAERKRAEEKKRKEAERKRAEEKKRKEVERKRAEEKKRKEAERKRAEEKKRKEVERKRAEEKKRKEVERERQEALVRKQIEKERVRQTKQQAVDAFQLIKGQIQSAIVEAWAQARPQGTPGLKVTIQINFSPAGEVLQARVVKSSNNKHFDNSAERAVRKASPLPFPVNPEYYPYLKEVDFIFNPDGVK